MSSADGPPSAAPENHVPACASSLGTSTVAPSYAWSLAFVAEVCGTLADEVSTLPLASLTTTWASPVDRAVRRKGIPARRAFPSPAIFTKLRSPRITCSGKVGAAYVETVSASPSGVTRTTRSSPSAR